MGWAIQVSIPTQSPFTFFMKWIPCENWLPNFQEFTEMSMLHLQFEICHCEKIYSMQSNQCYNQSSILKSWLWNVYQYTTNYKPYPNLNLYFFNVFGSNYGGNYNRLMPHYFKIISILNFLLWYWFSILQSSASVPWGIIVYGVPFFKKKIFLFWNNYGPIGSHKNST